MTCCSSSHTIQTLPILSSIKNGISETSLLLDAILEHLIDDNDLRLVSHTSFSCYFIRLVSHTSFSCYFIRLVSHTSFSDYSIRLVSQAILLD